MSIVEFNIINKDLKKHLKGIRFILGVFSNRFKVEEVLMSVTKTFFLKVDVNSDGSFKVSAVAELFDQGKYLTIQIERALTCELNRNAVRERYPELHDVSDKELTEKHKHELMTVFFENKGADWAVEHIRPLCVKLEEIPLTTETVGESSCVFLNLSQVCKKCPECAIQKLLRNIVVTDIAK